MSISVSDLSAAPRQAAPVLRLISCPDAEMRSVRPGEPGWFEAWQDPSSWECLGPSARRSWADDIIDRWHRRRRASRRRTSGPTALPAGAPALRLV